MEFGIGKILYESIIENKWIDISYNQENGKTFFWIAIIDIVNNRNKTLKCKIINYKKNHNDAITTAISADKILTAKLINGSYFKCDDILLEKIQDEPENYLWLEIQQYNINILKYISDCNKYDNDPYILDKDCHNISGLNFNDFKRYSTRLSQKTLDEFINIILKVNKDEVDNKLKQSEICLSSLAISIKNKKYIIAYRKIGIDFDKKIAVLDEKSTINKSFLVDGKKCSLNNYIDCDVDEFIENYDIHPNKFKELIRENLSLNEKMDTREEIFVLKRDFSCDLDRVANKIIEMEEKGTLAKPMMAYFGKMLYKKRIKNKEPYIVIRNKNSNPDQIRVVYNSMTNYITYVEGPPGTGKTKTIVDVILSAMANNHSCLICSNNNKPIDDIYNSIKFIHSNKEEVLFPMIRLGNNEVNLKALETIKNFYYEAKEILNRKLNESLTEKSKEKGLSLYKNLKTELEKYERKQELINKEKFLKKILKDLSGKESKKTVFDELQTVTNELKEYEYITDENIRNFVIPADENDDYKNYLFYKSLFYIKKLASKENADLRDIVLMGDKEEALKLFNKYLSANENIKKFISIFPFILTTNISANKLGEPFPYFDICIMDEAGQCNIATSILPIVRAKSLLLVGDINQLKPVIVLERNLNNNLMRKYKIPSEYNYLDNSILSLMKNRDKISKYIKLRYHYRCPKKIINFCNTIFYDSTLILENKKNAEFKFINVENNNKSERSNAYEAEADAIVSLLKKNKYDDVSIITPFRNQAELINKKLMENNISNINAGTIHTIQGAEKNTIILSAALSIKTGERTFNWIKNNQQLINVGMSRSKENFIMVGDYQVIKLLDNGEESAIFQLAEYVRSNGDITNIKPTNQTNKNLSNDSLAEKEMYQTLIPFFKSNGNITIERNQKVKDVFKISEDEYSQYYFKAEFDFVIYKKLFYGKKEPVQIIELDGGEHISCEKAVINDRKKEIICNKKRVKILRVPNVLSKDYDYLISILSTLLKMKKPVTLFDDDDE